MSVEDFIVLGPNLSFNGNTGHLNPIIVADGFHRVIIWGWEQYYLFSVNDCCRSSSKDTVHHWVTIENVFGS